MSFESAVAPGVSADWGAALLGDAGSGSLGPRAGAWGPKELPEEVGAGGGGDGVLIASPPAGDGRAGGLAGGETGFKAGLNPRSDAGKEGQRGMKPPAFPAALPMLLLEERGGVIALLAPLLLLSGVFAGGASLLRVKPPPLLPPRPGRSCSIPGVGLNASIGDLSVRQLMVLLNTLNRSSVASSFI